MRCLSNAHSIVLPATAGLALIAGVVAVSWTESMPVAKLMQQTDETLRAFIDRSPGERLEALIRKGKGKSASKGKAGGMNSRRLAAGQEPEQRALGKIFEEAPEDAVAEILDAPAQAIALPETFAAPIASLLGLPNVPGSPGGIGIGGGGTGPGGGGGGGTPPGGGGGGGTVPGGGGGGGTPPGGGGGGGTPPGGGTSPDVPGVVSPVPEPTTWIMLLMGMVATGGAMRQRSAFKPARKSRLA